MKICEFTGSGGGRTAIKPGVVEAIVEQEAPMQGCLIVTANDTFMVREGYEHVRDAIWPNGEADG